MAVEDGSVGLMMCVDVWYLILKCTITISVFVAIIIALGYIALRFTENTTDKNISLYTSSHYLDKHWKISASSGADKSMELLQRYVTRGDATKDDYEKILRAHNHFVNGMKSEQREKATQLRKQGLGQHLLIRLLVLVRRRALCRKWLWGSQSAC